MNCRRGQGFTLVEGGVALAVLSLIMLATVSGLRTLGNTQATLDTRVDRLVDLRSGSSFLRNSLASTVKGSSTGGLSLGGGMQDRAVFELSPEGALVWKAVVLFGEAYGGQYLVRLGKKGGDLELRWREDTGDAPLTGWNKAASRTLVSGVDRFEVAYRREAGGPWQTDWDQRGPPGWVRLRLQVQGRYWPDLVMEVAR